MNDSNYAVPETTIGVDLGDRRSRMCVLDAQGQVISACSIATTRSALQRYFAGCEPCRVALEVGTHSPWVSRVLEDCGHEVLVANARKLRMIYASDNKTDKTDAEMLARVARLDPRLLYPIHHRGPRAQADLALIRSRGVLVESRTRLINHVRGSVKWWGERLPTCSTPSFAKKVTAAIPEQMREALGPVLEQIASLTAKIREMDKSIERKCEEDYPETGAISQPKGVGPLTALRFILTLEDAHRFKKSRDVGPYLGMTPRTKDSGKSEPQLRITKAGDVPLRTLLVNCAQYMLGPFGEDSDLRQVGLRISERGGKNAKKRAVVAVARKLAVLMHRLWVSGEVYEPLRNNPPAAMPEPANQLQPA
jgi:transposase